MWSPAERGVGRGRADARGRRKILYVGFLVLTGMVGLCLNLRPHSFMAMTLGRLFHLFVPYVYEDTVASLWMRHVRGLR